LDGNLSAAPPRAGMARKQNKATTINVFFIINLLRKTVKSKKGER
jgi:hypothetical protein